MFSFWSVYIYIYCMIIYIYMYKELYSSRPFSAKSLDTMDQVPEDRLGRLEQEYRTLALELRLSISVAEEVGTVCFSGKFDRRWK